MICCLDECVLCVSAKRKTNSRWTNWIATFQSTSDDLTWMPCVGTRASGTHKCDVILCCDVFYHRQVSLCVVRLSMTCHRIIYLTPTSTSNRFTTFHVSIHPLPSAKCFDCQLSLHPKENEKKYFFFGFVLMSTFACVRVRTIRNRSANQIQFGIVCVKSRDFI